MSSANILTMATYNIIQAESVALVFDYLTEETSSVDADITDNWVESNYTIQDHIAVKPRVYRLRGCVGEVVFENQSDLVDWANQYINQHPVLQKTQSVVNSISSVSGVVSNYTRTAINLAKQLESSYKRYKQIWQNFKNTNSFVGTNKKQKYAYAYLTQLLQSRTPVLLTNLMYTGEGEWFKNNNGNRLYYLQNVSIRQGNSKYISDIEVTIKEFRIATTQTTKVNKSKFGGMTATQKTAEANNGVAKGQNITLTTKAELVAKSGGEIRESVPKNPIKKFFWQIQKQNESYNKSINDFNYYSVY